MKSWMLDGDVLEAVLVTHVRQMSPEQYLEFTESHSDEVKNVRFVPPRIGSEGFGVFEVETRTPQYEVCLP
ncbi:hypothetical protein VUJ49_09085 [Pseudomonas berkeleyensis]|uniref:Uncharacterized protein n=1 Tax=Pseudomonas berkeleyensis TaxID=2726956 RepID=A0A7G5DTW5_9PSED|nr:hypothetical protein [Pseudomonas berkeleyensis]QMV65190.1 hypothetical protein HS968_09050 [Pseudomonas berkeleyensis]WSO40663.1 hypothetical protein VUJ49_09085 [Pseudomonas berkeleyensis]